jgi:hypothetical protein
VDHLSNLEYITSTGAGLVERADSQQRAERLRADLDALTGRWTEVSGVVDQRVERLETALTQLRQYQVADSASGIGIFCCHCC